LQRNTGDQSTAGLAGNGVGTKVWAFSPTVDMVMYLPWISLFALYIQKLKYDCSLFSLNAVS
jgi:hypothetical protein